MGSRAARRDRRPRLLLRVRIGIDPHVRRVLVVSTPLLTPCFKIKIPSDQYRGKALQARPRFDINTVPASSVAAIDFYAGPSQTPLKYAKLNSACGVLVIHTRR